MIDPFWEQPYSPMTLMVLDGERIRQNEVWPDEELYGLPVLLAGGEVGVLRRGGTPRIAPGGSGRWSSPTTPKGRLTGSLPTPNSATDRSSRQGRRGLAGTAESDDRKLLMAPPTRDGPARRVYSAPPWVGLFEQH